MNKIIELLFDKNQTISKRLEREYKESDRFMLNLILFHWVLSSSVTAYLFHAFYLGFFAGGALFFVTYLAHRYYSGTKTFRIIVSIVLLSFSLVFIQQSLGLIEMHFHVFIALSFLVIYRDMMAITVGAL